MKNLRKATKTTITKIVKKLILKAEKSPEYRNELINSPEKEIENLGYICTDAFLNSIKSALESEFSETKPEKEFHIDTSTVEFKEAWARILANCWLNNDFKQRFTNYGEPITSRRNGNDNFK